MLKNILLVVDDIEKSIRFYKELFGLQVILQQEGNVILSEGLVLQESKLWKSTINEAVLPHNNMSELYFEEMDVEAIIEKYESGEYPVRYLTGLMKLESGQKMVRLYDPSGNLIEIRTPVVYTEGF